MLDTNDSCVACHQEVCMLNRTACNFWKSTFRVIQNTLRLSCISHACTVSKRLCAAESYAVSARILLQTYNKDQWCGPSSTTYVRHKPFCKLYRCSCGQTFSHNNVPNGCHGRPSALHQEWVLLGCSFSLFPSFEHFNDCACNRLQ